MSIILQQGQQHVSEVRYGQVGCYNAIATGKGRVDVCAHFKQKQISYGMDPTIRVDIHYIQLARLALYIMDQFQGNGFDRIK
jgi:hypothetical protein